jgi:uncharacterized membrane protein
MWWLTRHRRAIDAAAVRAAIERAERGTSAEIVVSVAPFFLGSVGKAAERAFARLGVSRTRERNGVLIFLVPSRRQVIVRGDEGVHQRLGDRLWTEVAARVAAAFGRGQGTAGLVEGIELLGRELAGPFPRLPSDINELPDEPDVT